MITTNETACLTPRSCCYVPVVAAIVPSEYQGGILCSERGQSHDAFQATPLEETSRGAINTLYHACIPILSLIGQHMLDFVLHV